MKTESEIINDLVRLVKESALGTMIGGEVYPEGGRPRNSKAQDVTVSLSEVSELYGGLLQSGICTVNVYVVNKAATPAQTLLPDTERIAEVEGILQTWVESLKERQSCYLIWQRDPVGHDYVTTPFPQFFAFIRLNFTLIPNLNG